MLMGLQGETLEQGVQSALQDLASLASVYFEFPIVTVVVCHADGLRHYGTVGSVEKALNEALLHVRHALHGHETLFIVKDASRDARFCGANRDSGQPEYRFFGAAALTNVKGDIVGYLCLLDRRPRPFSESQEDMLRLFAKQASSHLERQHVLSELEAAMSHHTALQARMDRTERLAGFGTWEFDFGSNAIAWSAETFEIFGVSPSEGVPNYEELLRKHTEESRHALHQNVVAAIKEGKSYSLELDIIREDGIRRVVACGETVKDAGGLPRMLVGTVRLADE